MATFYLDFEGGNDANDGTTFANRWKTITSGATAARTAPGDTIRIMGSPAPTSLGQNGVWTSQALQGTKNITGATNATPIAITCTAHGYSTGDTVVIASVGGNTAANGTWEITSTGADTFTLDGSAGNAAYTSGGTARLRNNTRVMLASAVTQNIASTGPGRAAWTSAGGANVVTTLDTTTFKEHRNSDNIAIAAGFTTGLAAYWPTGTIDLSGYQQVSFWIRQTTGTIGAAGAVDLRLCSDAAGVTAVNTINIPNLAATGRWMPVTVDLGTALGSSIQSIALYVNTDNGAQTFLLNNIIACKASSAADSLTLTSLIGKNTTGETFWGIQSINGTRVMLDADTNATPTSTAVRGYYGTSETVTTWKRETIKLGPAASVSTALQTIQEGGTDGSPIAYSGGWDRTAMSTQNLETWLDGQNGNGRVFNATSINILNINGIAVTRVYDFISSNLAPSQLSLDAIACNNSSRFMDTSVDPIVMTIGHYVANAGSLVTFPSLSLGEGSEIKIKHYIASNGAGSGIFLGTSANLKIVGLTSSSAIRNNGGFALVPGTGAYGSATFYNLALDFGINFGTNNYTLYAVNCSFTTATTGSGRGRAFYSNNHDKTTDNHRIELAGATIVSATDERKTASGISWKIQPTSTSLRFALSPVVLSLAKVACAANSLVTVKAWMRRSNTGLTMRLVCKGGQIAGVDTDVVDAMSAAADTWAEQTITFTPTEVGVVEITAEAYGGTTFSGWVDDMTISQA
jgi:hypothetical protein